MKTETIPEMIVLVQDIEQWQSARRLAFSSVRIEECHVCIHSLLTISSQSRLLRMCC